MGGDSIKLQAGKGKGYEQWATIYNLKEASKTINFLTDNGVADYEDLEVLARDAEEKFNSASARNKQLEARLSELSALRTHIINYSKTRDVYAAYRKSKNKKDYRARHVDEIEKHEAAKKAFDALGGAPIPKVAEIQAEFSSLLAEKKSQYEIYKTARKDMIDYQTAKQNIDHLLRIHAPQEKRRESER